jgi:L-alanine-DL-glutamate epimerase-like enolase superfamily enzyme
MRIVSVDPFYLKIPKVTDAADGTQDTFLVRVRTDEGLEGWGESDASPLVSLACYCCPMSHGNIVNISEALLGESVDSVEDVVRLHAKVLRKGLDIQQVHHAYAAADLALWDLLGKRLGRPVWRLLDGPEAVARPKRPYASVLFGDTPQATLEKARGIRAAGFDAAKFGWGPMGKLGRENDVALVRAAREGMGEESLVLVDAGVVWGRDDATAYERACDFAPYRIGWLEEPFLGDAIEAYARLAARKPPVPIAGGEASGRFRDAEDYVLNAGVSYVQIDVGRIGGITPAHRVRKLAEERGVTYVNHTFKSHLSVAASIHVFAAVERFRLLEYPTEGSPLARALTVEPLGRDPDGLVRAPEAPGLGVTVDLDTVRKYLHAVKIEVAARTVFSQPAP